MAKTIMNSRKNECYLCRKLYGNDNYCETEEHHVFDGPNRKLSEHYGLKVYLCAGHHQFSNEAVHINAEINRKVQRDAQEVFEEEHPDLDFRAIFGRNYL